MAKWKHFILSAAFSCCFIATTQIILFRDLISHESGNTSGPQRSLSRFATPHASNLQAFSNRSVNLPRVVAIVFPQFHRDPLNDKLWGNGFTDWHSLRAAPAKNRLGFEIPRPTDLGYYDLSNTSTRKAFTELAKAYDIDGFVYHHYWFYDPQNPGPNLHKPLTEMLKDGHPNVPFFFNWCAVKWTATWSGKATNTTSKNDILQQQYFPETSDAAVDEHYKWLREFFRHPNYMKVNGQPILMLYQKKPRAFPILKYFRERAMQDGFPGLYIIVGMTKTHDALFPEGKNQGQRFNHWPIQGVVNRTVAYPNPIDVMSKQVLKVPEWCNSHNPAGHVPGSQIPGILTSFDNTPRRDAAAANLWSADEPSLVIDRFNQSLYAAVYYESCCFSSLTELNPLRKAPSDSDERLILINAMNEWAEGMAMEPSTVYGRAFLESVKQIKANVSQRGCVAPLEGPTTEI